MAETIPDIWELRFAPLTARALPTASSLGCHAANATTAVETACGGLDCAAMICEIILALKARNPKTAPKVTATATNMITMRLSIMLAPKALYPRRRPRIAGRIRAGGWLGYRQDAHDASDV
jgi:hypothetical protein